LTLNTPTHYPVSESRTLTEVPHVHRTLARYLAVPALAVLPWLSGLDVEELAWEGDYLVGDNPLLDAPDVWTRAFSEPWAAGVGHELGAAKNRGYYRPLATLDLAVERRLWGEDPRGWRCGALVLHAGQAAALLRVLGLALPAPAAAVLTVAWAWHPLHSEVLGSVGYRTTALTALLGLLALGTLARPGRPSPARLAGGLALAGLALFTKESAVTFAVALPMAILALDPGPDGRRTAGRTALGLAALAGGYWLIRSQVVEPVPGAVLGYLGLGERVALMTKAVTLYSWNTLWPAALNPHYDISLFFPPFVDGRTWVGLALIAGILALTGLGLARRRPWSYALLAGLAVLGPVSGLVPLRVLAADRFLVLPLAFALLAAVLAWRARGGLWPRPGPGRVAVLLAAVLALSALGVRSRSVMNDWRSLRVLLEARVRDFPESVDAQLGLGHVCLLEGELACSREHLDAALEIYPGYPVAEAIRADLEIAEREAAR